MADKKLTARIKEIDMYLRATTNLYGFMPPIQFLTVFNRYHKEAKLLKSELMLLSEKLNRKGNFTYFIYSNAIISDRVAEEIVDKAYAEQQGKRFYIPTEEEIRNYSDNNYFELTPQVKAFKDYISDRFTFSDERLADLIRSIVWTITIGDNIDAVMKILGKKGVTFKSFDECQKVIPIIIDLINNTRIWANGGHTPTEMHKLFD